MKQRLAALALALLAAGVLGPAGPVFAKKSKLSPATIKQIKTSRKSFENCRKDALKQLKKGSISKKKFEVALNACTENFPGASLYTTCKKSAIKTALSNNTTAAKAIEECKRFLLAASFDDRNPVPFFVNTGQIYFAGIGLNRAMPSAALDPPNFDCERLESVARDPAKAQYFLFGNHPRTFTGLAEKKGKVLMQTLKLKGEPGEKGADVEGFGRVFGDPKGKSGVVFFPTAPCDFDAEPGEIYAGLSAYYLLDQQNSGITPYFGIAYYKQGQEKITTQKLVEGMIKELGRASKRSRRTRRRPSSRPRR
jgi:hypothetical protein